MDKDQLLNILQTAYDSGNYSEAQLALDKWEDGRERTRRTLSFLRFHRQQLEQTDAAVSIAREMLEHSDSDVATLMSDHLALSCLYLDQDNHRDAWDSVTTVLDWNDLPEYFDVGMARTAIDICMSIALASTNELLASRSFNAAMDLLDAGSSVSPRSLDTARKAARKLNQAPRFESYCDAAQENR